MIKKIFASLLLPLLLAGGVFAQGNGAENTISSLTAKQYEQMDRKGKTIILFFTASWCGPCQLLKKQVLMPLYQKYKTSPKVLFFQINAEGKDEPGTNGETLVKMFGVNVIPHLYIIRDNRAVISEVGYEAATKDVYYAALEAEIKAHL